MNEFWLKLLNYKNQGEQPPSFVPSADIMATADQQRAWGMPSLAHATQKSAYGQPENSAPWNLAKSKMDLSTWSRIPMAKVEPTEMATQEAVDMGGETSLSDLSPEQEQFLRETEPMVIRMMETLGESLEQSRERVKRIMDSMDRGE